MHAAARIEQQSACSELECARLAALLLDDELAACVVVRIGEEERGGYVGAYPDRMPRDRTNGAIDVRTVLLAAAIGVEQRRHDLGRQRVGHEERMALEHIQNKITELDGNGMRLGQLAIAFDV